MKKYNDFSEDHIKKLSDLKNSDFFYLLLYDKASRNL